MTPLRVLVTAGATEVPIDRVRAITNIFKGKTGTEIAIAFAFDWSQRTPHSVTLLTSNPLLAGSMMPEEDAGQGTLGFGPTFDIIPYRTFDELATLMEREITTGGYDVIIHSAAVSDYRVAGVHTRGENGELVPLDASGKIGSGNERIFLEFERTPKLVEKIKRDWGFLSKLVQFKLEVGISDEELVARARDALERSGGDLCVANCLEWARDAALLIDRDGSVERVDRAKLPAALVRWSTRAT